MPRIFFILLFGITTLLANGQQKFGFGIELPMNYAVNGHQIAAPFGCNGFLKYNRYEIYSGVDFYKLKDENAKTFVFEGGFKLYALLGPHWCSLFLDVNFQRGKWSGGTIYNTRYNLIPNSSALIFYKAHSSIISILPGFRFNFGHWSSLGISAGPGLNFYNQKEAYDGLIVAQDFNKKVCNIVLMVKIGLRLGYNIF